MITLNLTELKVNLNKCLPQWIGQMSKSCEPVNELIGHVDELVFVGSAGEGCTQDRMNLNGGKHRAQTVKLLLQFNVLARVLAENGVC